MDANAVQQLLDSGIPLTHFIGLRVDDAGPGRVRLRMPFGPNAQNHLGTAYAGAIFSLAEIAGAVAVLTAFDPAQFLMVARRIEIDYVHPARSDLTCAPDLPDDLVAGAHAALAAQGKADLALPVEVTDAGGEVVARVLAIYHLRRL